MRKIKKSIINALFCLIVFQSGSFLFAEKKAKINVPDWVNTPSSVYPTSEYFSYIGSGSDRKTAELEALKGIASIFGQSIKSETTASSRMTQAKENGIIANSEISTIAQSAKKIVDIDNLIGVEISNYWYDEISTWYAIATLNKKKTALIYKDMITKNINTFDSIIKKINETDNSFDTYALYDFSEDISIENEKLVQRLSVINTEAAASLKKQISNSKEIHLKKTEMAKKIPIYVQVENDVNGRFTEAFIQGINKTGFYASSDSSARYSLSAKFDFNETETTDKKTIKCKYNGEAYLYDNMKNQQFFPYSISGRESHVSYNEAKDKAVKKIIEKITTDYSDKLNKYTKDLMFE